MPRIDPYLKYPEFQEVRDKLLNTSHGKDLYSILTTKRLPEGYKLKDGGNHGKFYLDAGSRTYIRKNSDGSWKYQVLTDGRVFHEEVFHSVDEALKQIWVKILVKRTPTDVKRADFEAWLNKPDCSARGKDLDIEGVVSMYLGQFSGAYRISESNIPFDSPLMEEVFDFLGLSKEIENDQLLRPKLVISRLFLGTQTGRDLWEPILGGTKILETYRTNPVFSIKSSPKKGVKHVKSSKWGLNTEVWVTIHAETKEEMEKEILNIMKANFPKLLGDITEDEDLIKMVISLLTPEIESGIYIKEFSSYINKNPKLFLKLPEKFKDLVRKELGFTEELEKTIQDATDFNLL